MTVERMIFYGALLAMFCVTTLISHCTYQTASCKKEAIKASIKTEDIHRLCSMG